MKNAVKYGFGAIALYLVVANGTKAGSVITSGANGLSTVTRSLQGR